MSEISVHGKRFYPEPTVSFPRLFKPASPVKHTLLPPLMPLSPPPTRPMTVPPPVAATRPVTPPPVRAPSAPPTNVPLPGVPHLANYMLNNRVPFTTIGDSICCDIGLAKCASSKDLIEAAKLYSDDLTPGAIANILDLRDEMFTQGGTYVFTPEQFVQFYAFYNMFLTEERSWDPRLSEKFYNSSRTRLRCSCRWSPRLNKRARTEDGRREGKQKCSACYDMSYWPRHKLVIWECIRNTNHSMSVNAAISHPQYIETLIHRMKTFKAHDISIMIKHQLGPAAHRLYLDLFDSDRVRAVIRSREDTSKSYKDPDLSDDLLMASQLTGQCTSPDIVSRLVTLKYTRALILLHKDVFRSMFYSDKITISTNYKVSVHGANVSLLTLTGADGRHGVSIFVHFDETDALFGQLVHMCLKQIEEIGFELFGINTPSFVGLANIHNVSVSISGAQRSSERLSRQSKALESVWNKALSSYDFLITDSQRFSRDVQDPDVLSLLEAAHASTSVKTGENLLLEAINLCVARKNSRLESYVRSQFQHYHKWGVNKNRWTVRVENSYTCFDGLSELPFCDKHSIAASALQFTSWLSQAGSIRPKPTPQPRIALSSVLCTPPASDDD